MIKNYSFMRKLLASLKLIKNRFNEKGQILLFVIVILGVLLFILFAILLTVRTDIKETALEREYEQGYSVAEEELFQIGADGLDGWKADNVGNISNAYGTEYQGFCDGVPECWLECGLGEDGDSCVIVKVKYIKNIHDMTITQDETLEVLLDPADGNLDVTWQGAEAMSVILVCKDGNDYPSVRAAVCNSQTGPCSVSGGSGFITIGQARTSPTHDTPLNINGTNGCAPYGSNPQILRLRAIKGDAFAVGVYKLGGADLTNPQMVEVRVQALPEGGDVTEDVSAPEVYTLSMLNKRLPSLFDYVLYVANGEVDK
ncbi:MAG: hypothetical protein PHS44_05915 [Candidatus Dojkabacteria bacterium]|nr:hypothetical protein [Candidatus Dojkabacteria bacterium]